MKTIAEIKAWLTGKPATETQGAETPDENQSAPTVETLSALAVELKDKQTALDTREGELTTLATSLAEKQTTLTELETTLTQKETAITERETALAGKTSEVENKEKTADALKQAVGNVTTPIKPENATSNVVAAYNAEKDPAKKIQLFRKHKKEILAAK
jgi:uncharacterized protein (DUF3084 family)